MYVYFADMKNNTIIVILKPYQTVKVTEHINQLVSDLCTTFIILQGIITVMDFFFTYLKLVKL